MPECAEVQIMVDGLREISSGWILERLDAVGGRYERKRIPGSENFCSRSVLGCRRRGKAVVIDLTEEKHVVVTLGMTGRFSLEREKHAAVEFVLNEGAFFFVDQRRFGTVRVFSSNELESSLPVLGWDALADDIDVPRVLNDLRKTKKNLPIGSVMLDGRVFSGVGNYMRAEILYAAKISPWRRISDLNEEDVRCLCEQAQRIARRSYELGGCTLENFSNLRGGSGSFSKELRVYGRRSDPDGNEVVAEKTPEGRTIHWSPSVQM